MTMVLVPCPHCDRHVKASDVACPFCSSSMPQTATVTGRVSGVRAAVFFGASAVVVACGGKGCGEAPTATPATTATTATSSPSSTSTYAGATIYGAPFPVDAGASDAKTTDAMPISPAAAYGAPPKKP